MMLNFVTAILSLERLAGTLFLYRVVLAEGNQLLVALVVSDRHYRADRRIQN